jgi:hypothetical protein
MSLVDLHPRGINGGWGATQSLCIIGNADHLRVGNLRLIGINKLRWGKWQEQEGREEVSPKYALIILHFGSNILVWRL